MFEPPKRITTLYYRCSKRFILDKIADMYLDETKYGVVLIAGNGYMFYEVVKSGSHVEINLLYDDEVRLQKKQGRGGSSAARFERTRQEKELWYIKGISEKMVNTFMTNNNTELTVRGLIIGGPAQLKHKVIELPLTQQMFGKHIMKVIDTPEINGNIIWDIYERCSQELADDADKDAIKLVDQIKTLMMSADDRLVYGITEVTSGLKECALQKLLISSNLSDETKKTLHNLNTYGCEIIESNPNNFRSIGVDSIGIRWY
jgi:peptide subunit release factor 1 (eRF1)